MITWSGREFSVRWTNGRYAMRLIFRRGTEGPPVSPLNCDSCGLRSYDLKMKMCILLLLLLAVNVSATFQPTSNAADGK